MKYLDVESQLVDWEVITVSDVQHVINMYSWNGNSMNKIIIEYISINKIKWVNGQRSGFRIVESYCNIVNGIEKLSVHRYLNLKFDIDPHIHNILDSFAKI